MKLIRLVTGILGGAGIAIAVSAAFVAIWTWDMEQQRVSPVSGQLLVTGFVLLVLSCLSDLIDNASNPGCEGER